MEQSRTAEVFDLQRERELRVRQATGGSGPPADGGKNNWLAGMDESTRFLARRKSDGDAELTDFIISIQFKDVALLCKNIKGRDVVFEWFDTELFSKQWIFYLSITPVGQENDDSKQIHPGGLDQHAESQRQYQHPEERSD